MTDRAIAVTGKAVGKRPLVVSMQRRGRMPLTTRTRGGMTLLEACVVIGVGSVIFATAVAVVASLMRWRVDQEQHRYFATARVRLADQFREDVRAASQWRAVAEGDAAWVLEFSGDKLARYEVDGSGALLRLKFEDGVQVTRERFSQPTGTTFDIHTATEASQARPLVELAIDYPSDGHVLGRKRLQVVGNLGADLRFVAR